MAMKSGGSRVLAVRETRRAVVYLSLCVSFGLLSLAPAGIGQSAGANQGGPDYIHAPAGLDPMPQHSGPGGTTTMDQMRQAERHRRVVADTARLQQLSNELKAEVDQAPADQLSLDVMRKAAEIEKLAHDLKNWMKY